ncbi:MAG: orotidine-5'-phosphate decarboxylase [Euryarchaeota archaeon]|nr:orotidine-5'-phosphate decarboxylase [Euryarchaeota archaeon]
MEPNQIWKRRWASDSSPILKKYMEVVCRKKSAVCLAADRYKMNDLFQLLKEVGPHIAALKTHVDLVSDWDKDTWKAFCHEAGEFDLLIFEDRKFADIGKISKKQMGGIYDIQSWSDLVTAHLISGSDIIAGIQSAWEESARVGGVLLLAQMSSRGNLLNDQYTDQVIQLSKHHEGVFGYIGNGSDIEEIKKLRQKVGEEKMIWTPGINISTGDGEMGQRYGDPYDAIIAGSDCIIVGSGIHQSESPADSAKTYAEKSWQALVDRV